MTKKKQPTTDKTGRSSQNSKPPGSKAHPAQAERVPPDGAGDASAKKADAAPGAPSAAPADTPPGGKPVKHPPSVQAEMIREYVFAATMAHSVGYENTFTDGGYKVYLDKLLEDAGNPSDPIEKMLLQQLALAHFRIGQLHSCAAHAKSMEAVKMYNSVTARLLGEFRRTALGLRAYRGHVPDNKPVEKLKLYKAAQ